MNGASTYSNVVDEAFIFILGTSVLMLIGVTVTMIWFAIRYNRKRHPKAAQIEGSILLETIWTVLPTILVLVMFYYGWTGFKIMRDIPEESMKVKVVSRMWSWLFEYENGYQSTELVVPVGQPISLDLVSQDVIHSFFVPAFRLKEDCMPGRTNRAWFEANRTGDFQIFCAEYCGDQHSKMLANLKVVEPAEFTTWLNQPREDNPRQILTTKGCVACHSLDGSRLVGPSFKGLSGRTETVIVNGESKQITVDEDYLRRSIMDPNAELVEGFQPLMPPQENLINETELDKIVKLLLEMK
jgi:cytochrome c oxidase subunit II